jgi:hypothetical protein
MLIVSDMFHACWLALMVSVLVASQGEVEVRRDKFRILTDVRHCRQPSSGTDRCLSANLALGKKKKAPGTKF